MVLGGIGVGIFHGPEDITDQALEVVSTEEGLLRMGQGLFYGKGRCGLCHTIGVQRGGKCPNLDGAGDRLTTEFIVEAMTTPSAYVRLDFDPPMPTRYLAQMPVINRPPIGLTELEMQSVILFVQKRSGR